MLMATTISSSINEKPRLHFLAALPDVIECLVRRRRALLKLSKLPSVIIKGSYDRHGGEGNQRTQRSFTQRKKEKLSFLGLALVTNDGWRILKRTIFRPQPTFLFARLWRRFPMLVSMRVAMGPREDRLSLLVAHQRPFSLKGGFCISGHEISQLQNRAQTQSRADDRFCHNTFSCFVIVRGVSWRSRV